jgi:hypothetical protein
MTKPIVFLSHASKDKRRLVALKVLLDRHAVGAIDFFLSSDGESIRLGTSWVHRVVEALEGAKLMFVFVSEEAIKSGWIFFEAGYSFGRKLDVVPCCLPGVQLRQLPAPLNLLQAQTLHTAKDLNSLLEKCNQVFGLRIPSKLSKRDFDAVFGSQAQEALIQSPIIWQNLVRDITVLFTGPPDGLATFEKLCRRKGLDTHREGSQGWMRRQLNGPGISLTEREEWFDALKRETISGKSAGEGQAERRQYQLILSPELFHISAPLVDAWCVKHGIPKYGDKEAELQLNYETEVERESHRTTTKLFESGIEAGWFRLGETDFIMPDVKSHRFAITRWSKVSDVRLGEFLSILVQREVLLMPKALLKTVMGKS